jgi:UDP-N-acetylglucosamine--N-acetylmuramyl-(pentapeptide) pyrophosphoryl-undecaprenol N-acetylglucosamine transferase
MSPKTMIATRVFVCSDMDQMLAHESSSRKPQTIALACGGTAGHVYPALAIAEAYARYGEDIQLLFLSTPDGFAQRLVPSAGHRLVMVQGAPWFGMNRRGKLRALRHLAVGVLQARQVLKTYGVRLAIGVGGYASAAAICAAKSLGISTVIHEANTVPGLTNSLLGRFVDRVYLGFAGAAQQFTQEREVVTGNPIRSRIASLSREPRRTPNIEQQAIHILVTGGSLGAQFLNRYVPSLLKQVADYGVALEVRHQVGAFDPDVVYRSYGDSGIIAQVESYIDNMADAYRWADFAIARAGAGTLTELAVSGLPALLVPLPHAPGNHQVKNAEAFQEAGAGWRVQEEDWRTEVVAKSLATFFRDREAWIAASFGARRFTTPDAAQAIVADCEALMAGRW